MSISTAYLKLQKYYRKAQRTQRNYTIEKKFCALRVLCGKNTNNVLSG